MPQIVGTTLNSNTLALGVSREYWDAYARGEEWTTHGNLGKFVLDVQGVSDHWKGAYFNSSPIPRINRRGEPVASQAFSDVGWTIQVNEWTGDIRWRKTDADDDQTQSLKTRAQDVGNGYWVRDEAVAFQLLNNATDTTGLMAIPNAPDGVALFSATDGAGAARFGVTGGNIVGSQDFTSGAGVRQSFTAAVSRMRRFTDTVSQPLHQRLDNFLVIASATDEAVLNEAFKQTMPAAASTTAQSNAGVSNVLFDAGYTINLWRTSRVATGVMFVVNTDSRAKPLIRVNRQKPEETPITMANSDEARRNLEEGLMWMSRTGYGVGLPYGIIKVTAAA